ncbi:hypothetical protein TNCV_1814811 [Trichonephila clavipes]|nr:hypothetical protein TNCV_1814811 [Trichonephila clavipes]
MNRCPDLRSVWKRDLQCLRPEASLVLIYGPNVAVMKGRVDLGQPGRLENPIPVVEARYTRHVILFRDNQSLRSLMEPNSRSRGEVRADCGSLPTAPHGWSYRSPLLSPEAKASFRYQQGAHGWSSEEHHSISHPGDQSRRFSAADSHWLGYSCMRSALRSSLRCQSTVQVISLQRLEILTLKLGEWACHLGRPSSSLNRSLQITRSMSVEPVTGALEAGISGNSFPTKSEEVKLRID